MATEGLLGFYVGTRNYHDTARFWAALGFVSEFETGHGSGQWRHPSGGPYLFINEEPDGDLGLHPILGVADADAFSPTMTIDMVRPFTPQHWGVSEALVNDPDGRFVSLQAPLPAGADGPDADAHHADKYGSA